MENSIEFRHITKYFPGVKALDDISFRAESGEVLAFVGENGAGKSTLLKILNGDYQQTSGEYLLNDEIKNFKQPSEAIEAGISVIYQERQIIMELSVAENVFLGNLPEKSNKLIDVEKLNRETQSILDEFGLNINARTKVKNLSIAYQQMVEIMKAYNRNSKVIAFDEPTASLSDSEIEILFNIIKKLKETGKVIIYVSHRMKELERIADKVVIFKDGKFVDLVKRSEVTNQELVKMMVGRDLGNIFSGLSRNVQRGEKLLEVKNLKTKDVKGVSFELFKGEILGFSGLVGAGRTEVMRALFGADPIISGEIRLEGKEYNFKTPEDAIDAGIVLCPEDRKMQGILPNLRVSENISISIWKNLINKFGMIEEKKEANIVEENIKKFSIKTPNAQKKIIELSGGNQQKCIVARWLATNPKVLILDEPTKGIDVGAKAEFYQLICKCAKQGMGVILISSELPEVIGLSDRIIIMKDGKISGEVNREEATEEILLSYAMLEEEAV